MRFTRLAPAVLLAIATGGCADRSGPLDPGAGAALNAAASIPATDDDLFLNDVELRPGVTADLHLRVFVNEERNSATCTSGDVVLAVPGFAHTAATWEPYAEALFAQRPEQTCAVIALDLPAHGGSGIPEGISFGELFLGDYTTAVLGTLEALGELGMAPATVIGHSQGGLLVQMAQQELVAGGSSLREAFGVREVQLLAPVPPAGVSWAFAESGAAAGVLGPLLAPDPTLGMVAAIPSWLWPILFFSNLSGELAPGAPSAAEVEALGYAAPAAMYASLQLVGAGIPRPSVAEGVFAGSYGTRLSIVALEQDQLIRPEEAQALLQHLLGAANGRKISVVSGTNAIHDLHLTDPAAILQSARPRVP